MRRDPETYRAWQRRSRERYQQKQREKGRRTGLDRRAGLKRHKRPNPVNRTRQAKRFEAQYLSSAYVEWIHSLPCSIPGCTRTDIEAAHVGRPKSRGGRWWEIAPLCGADFPGHHQEQEKRTPYVNEKYGVDLEAIAHAVAQRWMAYTRDEAA
jgi:hypothetical protein